MKTNIATDRSQSQRLLRCGVSADTADMSIRTITEPMKKDVAEWETPMLLTMPYNSAKDIYRGDYVQPAWSLSALLELLPKRINDEYNYQKYGFKIKYSLTFNDAPWQIIYEGGTLVKAEYFFDKSPVEACVKAIEWLTDNGYKLNEL